MAKGNHVAVKGDITGDIYYDVLNINDNPTPFLRLYMMVNGSPESRPVKGLRICVFGILAELTYGHVKKGSRIYVEGHLQSRYRQSGDMVMEVIAEEIDFIRNVDYERGGRVAAELKRKGLFNANHQAQDSVLSSVSIGFGDALEGFFAREEGEDESAS